MTSFYERAAAITGENRIKTKEPLNRYTTFRIGGEADFMAEPEKPEQIAELVDLCKEENVPFFIMGNGSNLLVSDNGYRGMIIHIAEGMSRIMVGGTKIIAQAGASLIKVAVTAKQHELTGMEFASGIPGSVGGAVYMNAGAYGGEMKHIISSVKVLDQNGQIYDISGSDMEFGYRHSKAEKDGLVVLEAEFELQTGDAAQIDAEMKRLAESRISKQPLEYPSAGSTFKRPEGYFAGALIEECGLKGKSVGGAQVSVKHAGFVINKGGASCKDVLDLCKHCSDTVFKEKGVKLEMEIRVTK